MDLEQPVSDTSYIKKIEKMGVVMNARYEALKVKWIDKD